MHEKKQPERGSVLGLDEIHLLSVITERSFSDAALNPVSDTHLKEPDDGKVVITQVRPLQGVIKVGNQLYFATVEIVEPKRKKHQSQAA